MPIQGKIGPWSTIDELMFYCSAFPPALCMHSMDHDLTPVSSVRTCQDLRTVRNDKHLALDRIVQTLQHVLDLLLPRPGQRV